MEPSASKTGSEDEDNGDSPSLQYVRRVKLERALILCVHRMNQQVYSIKKVQSSWTVTAGVPALHTAATFSTHVQKESRNLVTAVDVEDKLSL